MPREPEELIVVTGASSGIGRATAKQLAADGFHVLAGVRSQGDAAKLTGKNIEPIILDITNPEALRALADRVEHDPGARPLRAVVNNAGIAVNGPVESVPLDEWRRQFEVSVVGQIAVTQALMPALLARGGRVINIGSLGGKVAMPGFGPYSAAKFAMEAVSDALRREMKPFGLSVVIITPGAVSTGMTKKGLATIDRLSKLMSPEQHDRHDRLIDGMKAQVEAFARDGVNSELAAAVVSRAVRARKPRIRYTVGRDAALLTRMVRFIPDGLLDRILRRQIGLA